MPIFRTTDPELLPDGPAFEVDEEQIYPAQIGFTRIDNYALYFWRPYLGNTAFALWELLLSFCFGEVDTCYPSISRLARMLSNSDHSRAVVTGRRKVGAMPGSRPLHRGALDVLRSERLVQCMCRGQGSMATYTFRVRKVLPLLTPEQVQRLTPGLQRDHARWLERLDIDADAYQRAFAPSAASSITPERGSTTGTAHYTDSAASDSTNNTHLKEDPMNQWWQSTLQELRLQLTRAAFLQWLTGVRPLLFEDGVLTLHTRNALQLDWLEHRMAKMVLRELQAASHQTVQQVRFVCDPPASPAPSGRSVHAHAD